MRHTRWLSLCVVAVAGAVAAPACNGESPPAARSGPEPVGSAPPQPAPPPALDAPLPNPCDGLAAHERVLLEPAHVQQRAQAKALGEELTLDGEIVTHGGSDRPRIRAWLKEVAERSCRDDAWPDDVIQCLLAAKDVSARQDCLAKLPPDLRARHDQRGWGKKL